MNYRAFLFFAGSLCIASSVGCKGTTPSDSIPTDDIVAFIEVSDDGSGDIYASADLQVRDSVSNDYLQLVGDDRLRASFGNQSVTMTEAWAGRYQTSFDRSNAADVMVAFDRSKFDSAAGSVGVMPDPLDIGGFEGVTISRSLDSIVIELPETSFDKTVDIAGSCVSALSFDIGQSAQDVVVEPGDLYASNYDDDECDVTITLTSTGYGSIDPALHPDSTFVLTRKRSTTFYSVP